MQSVDTSVVCCNIGAVGTQTEGDEHWTYWLQEGVVEEEDLYTMVESDEVIDEADTCLVCPILRGVSRSVGAHQGGCHLLDWKTSLNISMLQRIYRKELFHHIREMTMIVHVKGAERRWACAENTDTVSHSQQML